MSRRVLILRDNVRPATAPEDVEVLPFRELRQRVLHRPWAQLFRYGEAELLTYRLRHMNRPFSTALLLRLLSRGHCELRDETDRRRVVTAALLAKLFGRLVRDYGRKPLLLRRAERTLRDLEQELPAGPPRLNLEGVPVYLRTDQVFGVTSGGSVGHIAGVLNHLGGFFRPPIFLTSDVIPTVRPDIETHVIRPRSAYCDFPELARRYYNETFASRAQRILADRRPGFFYQRYSLTNYAGVVLARTYQVPFVLEYNGSEIWLNRHWGERLPPRLESFAERVEMLNLRSAHLIVVVSGALQKELVHRGIAADKILINPNGVDPERYGPWIDGTAVRRRLGLAGKKVIGFIGTFGRWHGAEVLADAFGLLLEQYPEHRATARLLLIGDGITMPEVRANLERRKASDAAMLTGLVPQEQGPAHLAACDFLVSPHIPNPDGSEFFGSPTKLFEYMAMGRGILASRLAQINEVLAHDRTAWLVEPGDVRSLAAGMKRLLDDPALCHRLGEAARHEALAHYTWKEHTRRISVKLREACHAPAANG